MDHHWILVKFCEHLDHLIKKFKEIDLSMLGEKEKEVKFYLSWDDY